ncbi:uncharacterized protein LOC127239281 [Andrographis paniculata]|uniref:uncharacterized protein LOC127239281 n=1 Tax=Andrographis paniculata TaxID=175694 RepID=UPI0021E75EFF|nr:uncharacterized protein LOC127239281 [Andrographis paniculata]XP_051113313.1 uncharacterized protein LOC127239281 [Andrographis paniculata]XP_051113314.1 uncharacterized protein LOC127239281 [Andrographis paniculata]XP_051113316.1 uncharacterized protein LOC127239281 [Andrographis paniculata]
MALVKFQLAKRIQSLQSICPFFGCPKTSFSNSSLDQRGISNNVAIFWDLVNKPPKPFLPYDAATRLKNTAQGFGFVKHMIAYADRNLYSYVPPSISSQRGERKASNEIGTKVVEPYVCGVCGRRFYTNEKLVNHFKQIHESEHVKRMNQIETARGSRRMNLVAKYAMKMDKYRKAARDLMAPKLGYGFSDELKRAGFRVSVVSDKPDVMLINHMVDVMDKREVKCLFLVSDDSGFVGVLQEARLRRLKTVVVGDANEGLLKRTADASFSWWEILRGKAKKESGSVVGKWKDQNVLRRLEWRYDPEADKKIYFDEIEGLDAGWCSSDESRGSVLGEGNDRAWWELDSRSERGGKDPE